MPARLDDARVDGGASGNGHRRLEQAPVAQPRTMRTLREERRELHGRIVAGKAEAADRQRALGKHTARERLELLLDEGSFTELDMYRRRLTAEADRPHTDGVVTGSGEIHGRRVFVYAQDFTIFGGSLGEAHAAKIHKVMDLAIATGRRSSASTTAAAPGSRRASCPSTGTAGSSTATCRRPAWCRRSAWCSGRARAERRIHRR